MTLRTALLSLLAAVLVALAAGPAPDADAATNTTAPCDYFEGNGLVDCNSNGTDLPGTCSDGSLPSCDPLGGGGSSGGGGGSGVSNTDDFHICSGLVDRVVGETGFLVTHLFPSSCPGVENPGQQLAQFALGQLGCNFKGEKDSDGEVIQAADRQAFYRLQSLVDTFGVDATLPKYGQCSRAGACRFKASLTWESDGGAKPTRLACSYRFTA